MAGVRFTIQADPSQLTAGLDEASAKLDSWASSNVSSIKSTLAETRDDLRSIGLEIAQVTLQMKSVPEGTAAYLDLENRLASLRQESLNGRVAVAQLSTELRVMSGEAKALADQERTLADQQRALAGSTGDLMIGNVNLESMMTRVAVRMAIMYTLVRPLMTEIQSLVAEHTEWVAAGDRLDAMLATQGTAIGVSSEQVKQYALALAAGGKNSAADILSAFDAILQRTHDVNEAFQLTSAAEELSAISGQKVAQSAKLIADAIESGTVKQLQEEGIQFTGLEAEIVKVSSTGDRFLEIQGKISAALVDANGNLTTHVSTWNSFKTALENAWTTMGLFLAGSGGANATPGGMYGGVSTDTFNSATATPEERAAYLGGYQRRLAGQEDAHFGRQASSDAFAANQPKVDEGVIDQWNKLDDEITKAGDAGNATQQKIDGVSSTYDGLKSRLETFIASLEKVTGRSDAQNQSLEDAKFALANLPYDEAGAKAAIYAAALEKAGIQEEAQQQKINQAIEKNADLTARAAQSADDYVARVAKFGEVDQYLGPEAAALQKITDEYTSLSASADKRVAEIEKEQAQLNQLDPNYEQQNQYLEDEKQKILLSQAALEGLEAVKEQAFADDYLSKLAQKDTTALDQLATKSADVQLKIAQLFGGQGIANQLGADIAALLQNAQLLINSNNADVQAQLAGARGTMSPDDFAAFEAQLLAAAKLYNDQVLAGVKNATGVLDQQGQLAAQHWGQALQTAAQDGAALFDGLLAGSTTGLESSLNSIFKNVTKNAGVQLENAIVVALGGAPNPKAYSNPEDYQAALKQGPGNNNVNTAVGGIANLIGASFGAFNAFQQISQPGTSIGAGALAGLNAGASVGAAVGTIVPAIGNAIGAVVGAVVGLIAGGISAALSPSKGSQAQYLVPEYGAGDSRGWFAETSQNLNQAAVKQFLDQLTATMDTLNNGFINILAKFPGNLLAAGLGVLQSERFTGGEAAIGGDQWGTIGSAPSEHSMQQLQTYISSGLPQEIFGDFRNLLVQGFQNMGFSSGGANALINQAQQMDPKAAITFLSTIQDAITEFNKVIPNLSSSFLPTAGGADLLGGQTSIWQQAWQQTNQTFAASLADSQQQMLQLAATIPLLSGQDQADAIKQLADLNVQRYQAEIQFAQQLQAAALSMSRSFEADIRSKTVAGMKTADGKPDYGAQETYLQGYLSKLEAQAGSATTVDQLNYLQQQIQQTIDQMVSIADNSGDKAMASKYDQWGITALTQGEKFLNDQYQRLGAGIDDLNKQLTDAEAGFIQALKDGTLALNTFSNGGTAPGGGGGGGGAGGDHTNPNGDSGVPPGGPGTPIEPIDLTNLADSINGNAKTQTDRLIAAFNAAIGQRGGSSGTIVINLTVPPSTDGFKQSITIARQ